MSTSASPAADAPLSPQAQVAVGANRRKRLLTYLAAGVAAAAVLWGGYYILVGSHYVETDNAYVGAETAQVNALVPGPIAKIHVSDTQTVKAGDILVELDNADARIALAEAQADLALAARRVQGYYASDDALQAQMSARQAEITATDTQIKSAQSDYERAQIDLNRRKALIASGAVSQEELSTAQNQYARAAAALAAAQSVRAQAQATYQAAIGSRENNNVRIAGFTPSGNPEVLAAQAKVDAAKLAFERTVVRAPMDGVVARKSVQVGQQVTAGTPLMAVVPISKAYVDANFKEVQLKNVVPGQTVELTSDLYGDSVKFHGTVRGISGGTGSAFSLIPAQNASGNWIKVVQRLPVRIDLDPKELSAHPLRVGLSMKAKIDIADAPKAVK
ncbi:HlyD family secretion protein [Asticcacaulis machinosus]|uniref:Efflux RND transporter periplasmic adaptor subunit n=1 Tax=Asticcacaulis machinosus TaxID=2984211 RepID=A0ABT5HKL3_9CAUL|nr:HlyD family efflux transporter periplasmic adaptor subunit [Asticcacaulis machinosus]MDC7676691.1 efflux RND transporter periplasmic adaptor subunit [Asticcacaulis machinosus]